MSEHIFPDPRRAENGFVDAQLLGVDLAAEDEKRTLMSKNFGGGEEASSVAAPR